MSRDEVYALVFTLGEKAHALSATSYGSPNYDGERHSTAHAEYDDALKAVQEAAEELYLDWLSDQSR